MIVRELVTKLGFEADTSAVRSFDAAIDGAVQSVETLQANLDGVGRGLTSLGVKISTFFGIPLTLIRFGLVKAASDAEETASKFGVVFSSIRSEADASAETLVHGFGQSREAAQRLLSNTGDLLTGFGFSQEAALDLSEQTNQLAVDLASFTNIQGGAERASRALTKALIGERESVKELGIAILEEDVKARVQLNRTRGITFETERQAKAFATLQLAQEQSKNAIGDFERTSKSFANQFRIFRQRVLDVAVSFGLLLLPIATKTVSVFTSIVNIIDALPKPIKVLILVLTTLVATLGPILIFLGLIISSVGFTIIKFVLLRKVLAFFGVSIISIFTKMFSFFIRFSLQLKLLRFALVTIGRFLLGIAATAGIFILKLVAIGIAIGLVLDDIRTWVNGGESLIGRFLGTFDDFSRRVLSVFRLIGRTFRSFFSALRTGSEEEFEAFKRGLEEIASLVPVIFEKIGRVISKFLENLAILLPGLLLAVVKFLFKLGVSLVEVTFTIIKNFINFLLMELADLISRPVDALFEAVKERFPRLSRFLGLRGSTEPGEAADNTGGLTSLPRPEILSPFSSQLGRGQEINVDSEITLQLPAGTPEEQQRVLQQDARKMVREELSAVMARAINSNPQFES